MRPTKEYLEEKYTSFNNQIFEGQLPVIPIKLGKSKSALGYLKFRRHKSLFGKESLSGFSIIISTFFDLTEAEIEDTLIHEMIHYYIYFNNIKDTSSHGPYFREKMAEINHLFGRNIHISYKLREGILSPK